jgi:hypothetical protein
MDFYDEKLLDRITISIACVLPYTFRKMSPPTDLPDTISVEQDQNVRNVLVGMGMEPLASDINCFAPCYLDLLCTLYMQKKQPEQETIYIYVPELLNRVIKDKAATEEKNNTSSRASISSKGRPKLYPNGAKRIRLIDSVWEIVDPLITFLYKDNTLSKDTITMHVDEIKKWMDSFSKERQICVQRSNSL